MQKTAKVSVYLTLGALILGVGIFAGQFGLDPNPGWGRGRTALIVIGFLIATAPWIGNWRGRGLDRPFQSDLFNLPVLLIVIGVYFWFITISHDATSNYYSLLATSFRNGELSLPLKPDPALLQLPDPYDPAARQGIRVPLDLSLYNGKFYLYWGPAPSLLLAIVQPFLPGKIAEVDILFLFMCGIFLSGYLLIMHLWERFFPDIPKWTLIFSVLLVGLANPALWLLSQPKIYETAIAGAQFFFLAGLLSAVLAVDRQPASGWKLALAGSLWALAVGTRSVAVFSVVFMTLMVFYRLFRIHHGSLPKLAIGLLPLGLPLLAGAAGFGWYNWARFGSFLETGFRYQLAAPHLQMHFNELFSPAYVFQNLYNYVLNPFSIKEPFPFLYAVRGRIEEILPWQVLPELYTAQAITGFLYAAPFMVFAVLPVTRLVRSRSGTSRAPGSSRIVEPSSLHWITVSLLGSFLVPFVSLLAFFWAAMRYSEDFMPALTLLGILGYWQAYQLRTQTPIKGKMYGTIGVVLAGLSVLSALLLALSNYFSSGLLGK